MKIYMFRSGWNRVPSWSCSKSVYKPVWHTPLLSVQWINSWCWTEDLSETCRVSWQNKFVKLVHLFGFITKKLIKVSNITKIRPVWPALTLADRRTDEAIRQCLRVGDRVNNVWIGTTQLRTEMCSLYGGLFSLGLLYLVQSSKCERDQ